MNSKLYDVVDFVIANGGIDTSKLIAKENSVITNCLSKIGGVKSDFFGYHTP